MFVVACISFGQKQSFISNTSWILEQMQVLLVKIQSLFAISYVPSGDSIDFALCSRSDRTVTRIVVDHIRGLDSAIFALRDGSWVAVVHLTSINRVIRLLISSSRMIESNTSVTVYCVTIIWLQSHITDTSCEGKLTRFHGWRWWSTLSPLLLLINSADSSIFEIYCLSSWSFHVEVSLGLRLLNIMGRIDSLFVLGIFKINIENLFVILNSPLFLALCNKTIDDLLIW